MTHGSGGRPLVLVVDDVEANIVAMEALLRPLDCELVRALSGSAALIELLRREFAVVLLDVHMPEMDGFEVARLARNNPRAREVPILLITGTHKTPDSVVEGYAGYASGAVDVLFKPLDPHMLLSKVRIFLDLFRSKKRLADEIAAHERTLSELDAFNYSVSHDLRAPLRHVAGFARILSEDYGPKLDDDGRHLLERVASAAHRMDQLISDLLRLSQISRAKPNRKAFDLAVVAKQIVAEMMGADPDHAVEFVCPDEIQTNGDEQLLRIALENLLRNAWKFSSKSELARIEVGTTQAPDSTDEAHFVKDNGAGFDPALADRLFAPFQRLHSKDQFEGTGIGLAIVQRIIHHHRGRIWADAAPDQGATFFFTLGT